MELRVLLQLYRDLAGEHTAWSQRIHATLFHQGAPAMAHRLNADRASPGSAVRSPAAVRGCPAVQSLP